MRTWTAFDISKVSYVRSQRLSGQDAECCAKNHRTVFYQKGIQQTSCGVNRSSLFKWLLIQNCVKINRGLRSTNIKQYFTFQHPKGANFLTSEKIAQFLRCGKYQGGKIYVRPFGFLLQTQCFLIGQSQKSEIEIKDGY